MAKKKKRVYQVPSQDWHLTIVEREIVDTTEALRFLGYLNAAPGTTFGEKYRTYVEPNPDLDPFGLHQSHLANFVFWDDFPYAREREAALQHVSDFGNIAVALTDHLNNLQRILIAGRAKLSTP